LEKESGSMSGVSPLKRELLTGPKEGGKDEVLRSDFKREEEVPVQHSEAVPKKATMTGEKWKGSWLSVR